jgi:formylglycine-generating enzyme required for sulfatase activity
MKFFNFAIICCLTVLVTNQIFAQKKSKSTVTGWNSNVSEIKNPKTPKGFVFIDDGSFKYHQNSFHLNPLDKDTSLLMNFVERRITLSSFFIMQTEVTNKEYRAFTDWVRDSIGLSLLDEKYPNQDYRKKDGKLNWKRRKAVADSIYTCLKQEMTIENATTKTIEIDAQKINYGYNAKIDAIGLRYSNNKGEKLNIYPDTLCWEKEGWSYIKHYFNNKVYDNFPVVGVNYNQACAYGFWKTDMEEGAKMSYRLPTEAEWEYAATVFRNEYPQLDVRQNSFPWKHGQVVDKKGFHLANFGAINDEHGFQEKSFTEIWPKKLRKKHGIFNQFYTTPVKSFPSNDFGLYDMAGNVAEWVSDYATVEKLPFYKVCETLPDGVDELENDKKYRMTNPYRNNKFRGKSNSTDSTVKKKSNKAQNIEDEEVENRTFFAFQESLFRYIKYKKEFSNFPLYDSNANIIREPLNRWVVTEKEFSWRDVSNIDDASDGVIEIADTVYIVDQFDEMKEFYEIENSKKMHNINVLVNTTNPRIVKGGSWFNPPAYMLISSRQAVSENKQSACIGFRLAQTYLGPPKGPGFKEGNIFQKRSQ